MDKEGSLVKKLKKDKASFKFIDVIESRKYEDYTVDGKRIHCILIKCKIYKSDFAFAVLILDN